jgi:hypothetical protein
MIFFAVYNIGGWFYKGNWILRGGGIIQ